MLLIPNIVNQSFPQAFSLLKCPPPPANLGDIMLALRYQVVYNWTHG